MNRRRLRRHPALSSLWLLGITVLAGCQSVGSGVDRVRDSESLAESAISMTDYVDAAAIYERLASRADASNARRLNTLAALAWLDAGDIDRAVELASTLSAPQPGAPGVDTWSLLMAGIATSMGDWDDARTRLDALSSQPLPTNQRIRYQRWRASVLFNDADPALATSYLARRELWLTSERAIAENHQLIWDGLRATSIEQLYEALAATSDQTVRGWIELVVTTNPVRTNPSALATVVGAWSRRYIGHPANATFVPALIGDGAGMTDAPRQVALILPLGGRSERFAAAIRDGFLAAHIADLADGGAAPRIRVYDVSTDGATLTVQRALADGAEMVIGPLTKTALTELALQPALPVTTLALNRLPPDVLAPTGLYQFGLAPEDEARAAAERAIGLGLTRAVALAPIGDLGERLLTSFATHYQALGGTLLDYERYDPRETDFSTPIKRVMQIQSSIGRRSRLQNLLGERVEYEPRRRQDVDMIFMPASAASARQLKPQLAFHYSGDIPTFATAQIANADGRDSSELAGIEYAEIPWLVAAPDSLTPSAEQIAVHWRGEAQFQRLYALGMDAYRLIDVLGGFELAEPLAGASGKLSVDVDGVVRRQLVWSLFDGTEGTALPLLAPLPVEPIEESAWPEVEAQIGSN
ncbi:MAG: penicillin-binding protein activator [Pseudomonadota bacterium]